MAARVMERVGAQKPSYALDRREPASTTSMSSWFEDTRFTPDRTAAYLHKLTRLRDNLFQTENANLSNAISRTLHQGHLPKVNQGHPVSPRRRATFSSDEGPSLHARKQMEKMAEIDRRRRTAFRTPPPLTVGVRQIEGPMKTKPEPVKEKSVGNDPFDPSVLEPQDPMEKLFNMERIRLLNAMAAAQKNEDAQVLSNVKDRRAKPILRQSNLLTPRRGDEWFITGRYKKEERKPKSKIHKGSMSKNKHHRQSRKANGTASKQGSVGSEETSDSRSLEVESIRSDTRTEKGSVPPSTTPIVWDGTNNPGPVVDSTANLMNAIASTAEANKADVRAKTFHYDPSNYRPIGTPKSPRASSGSTVTRRYDDLRRTKAIAGVLVQGNVEEGSEPYHGFMSVSAAVGIRPASEQGSHKGSQAGVRAQRVHYQDEAIKVPGTAGYDTTRAAVVTHHVINTDPLEIIPKPPGTGQGKTEPLFVPASQAQPQINLRHASPNKKHKEEEVSLKKIFRQNELREKELNNLFEDIKELNKISDNLKEENGNNPPKKTE